jgi:hypothetical protein
MLMFPVLADLEGIDEFATDAANLEMFLRVHNKPTPQFMRQIADKTLLVGLSSTVFRDAKYTSHEVTIDAQQLAWFEQVVKDHPADDGWKLFVFTHAPPNGSGLRVLQENHVVNGCCWLNHSNEAECRKFIELVREHRCIKAWFSGHFHLVCIWIIWCCRTVFGSFFSHTIAQSILLRTQQGQDYQDSITFPTIDPKDGPYPNRGSCVFAQTSVMRKGTSRDTRQQSRLIRGDKDGFQICTVDHQAGGNVRVDATITYRGDDNEIGVYAHDDVAYKHDKFFKVYQPSAGDDLHEPDDALVQFDDEMIMDKPITKETVAWWYMDCGRVLGMLNGNLIEYDKSTLAPLGLVVGADELLNKRIAVINSGEESECEISYDVGMEGADCGSVREAREQAVLLIDDEAGTVTIVQPNEDGSYWRKIVRNKMIRMKEVRRERAAKALASALIVDKEAQVVSSWGPYTTTSGTAKRTGVSGVTTNLTPNGATASK